MIIQNAIQNHLNSLIAKTETKGKNTDYVKYLSQAKSDPYFHATLRRCNMLTKNIEQLSLDDKVAKIEYISNSGEAKDYLLHLEEITINNKNSSKTEKIITSPQIRQIMSNIQTSLDNIISSITTFYDDLLEDMISYSDSLDVVSSYVENIDVLQNKAYIATKYNYCCLLYTSPSPRDP